MFNIGEKLRLIREGKKLSQGEIEQRTGLLRCYLSRVENGHTVPSVETLEKLARGFDIPLHEIFYDGELPPELELNLQARLPSTKRTWHGKDAREIERLRRLLANMQVRDRILLLQFARNLVKTRSTQRRRKFQS